jgi:hypothetical protein
MLTSEIRGAELAPVQELEILGIQYIRSRRKYLYLLVIPALWAVSLTLFFVPDFEWAPELVGLLCIVALFGVSAFVFVGISSPDEIKHRYSQLIIPGLFRELGAQDVEVFSSHTVSTAAILDSKLYTGEYDSIQRRDCIMGNVRGMQFGMYEIAIQTGHSLSGSRVLTSSVMTNQFFGWFIMIPLRFSIGEHFIIMRNRVSETEADDWHKKTIKRWSEFPQFFYNENDKNEFNETFLVASSHPQQMSQLLTKEAKEFLMFISQSTGNAFGISIRGNMLCVLIGEDDGSFHYAPDGLFTEKIPDESAENARWYMALLDGICKNFAGKQK